MAGITDTLRAAGVAPEVIAALETEIAISDATDDVVPNPIVPLSGIQGVTGDVIVTGNVQGATLTADVAVDGVFAGLLVENSQANEAGSTNETAEIRFGFGGNNDVARISVVKKGDYTTVANEDSAFGFWIDLNGTVTKVVSVVNSGLLLGVPASKLDFFGDAGGGNQGIRYKDAGGSLRTALAFPGSDLVVLSNQAANGVVEIRANTSTAGSGGEVTVVTITDTGVGIGVTPAVRLDIGSTGTPIRQTRYSTVASQGAGIAIRRSKGATVGTDTVLVSGDKVGTLNFQGFDGASYLPAAQIQVFIDGDPGIGDMPGRLLFLTTADGASTASERMRIDSVGNVGIGVSAPGSILSLKMGTGTGVAEASAKANVNTTAVGTDAATTEKDLITYSLPANSLSADGKLVKIRVWGTSAANGNTKTIRLYFGATVVRQIGPSALNDADWVIEAIVVRTGASTQDAFGTEMVNNSSVFNTHSETAEVETGAITIKVTGQNGTAAANDIVAEGMLIEYLN